MGKRGGENILETGSGDDNWEIGRVGNIYEALRWVIP